MIRWGRKTRARCRVWCTAIRTARFCWPSIFVPPTAAIAPARAWSATAPFTRPAGALEAAIDYIRRTPAIRDVLISGGDPLTLGDERLKWLLERLRAIPHVEIIRIGTKVPAVLPQRITPALVRMLRKFHPLWLSLHFTHPDECTPEAHKACARLADAGIPLGSQTVLLRGINDNVETMKSLVQRLMRMRVRPYYLYQCDPISGSSHFRTSIESGLEIIRGLRGFTTGYAVPTYVIDAPGGGGKIPLMPDYVVGKENGNILLRNYENRLFGYPAALDSTQRGEGQINMIIGLTYDLRSEYLDQGIYRGRNRRVRQRGNRRGHRGGH